MKTEETNDSIGHADDLMQRTTSLLRRQHRQRTEYITCMCRLEDKLPILTTFSHSTHVQLWIGKQMNPGPTVTSDMIEIETYLQKVRQVNFECILLKTHDITKTTENKTTPMVNV